MAEADGIAKAMVYVAVRISDVMNKRVSHTVTMQESEGKSIELFQHVMEVEVAGAGASRRKYSR